MIRLLRQMGHEGPRHRGAVESLPPSPQPLMVQRKHISGPRWCFIDGCRLVATLVIESHPDDVQLCDEHRHLRHEPLQPWERVVRS